MDLIGAPAIQAHSLGARDVGSERAVDAVAAIAQEHCQRNGREPWVAPPAICTRIVPRPLQQQPQLLLHPVTASSPPLSFPLGTPISALLHRHCVAKLLVDRDFAQQPYVPVHISPDFSLRGSNPGPWTCGVITLRAV